MLTTDELINCQQAAQALGVSIKTIRQWAQSGKLQGQKVGSRGDWRFTHDELGKMLRIDKDKYDSVKQFLLENAVDIQNLANQKHISILGTDDAKLENLKKNHKDYVNIVKDIANNLDSAAKGKKTFLKIGATIAKKSVEQGLTLEETVDGTVFLMQAFWEKLEATGLLYKLTTHDLYALNQRTSMYTNIVSSRIVFAYNDYQKKREERVSVAEASLKKSDERFQMLADNIPNLAWMAEPDGYIYWYNKRWYEYTGTTPKDMEGWGWQSVHDPEALPQVIKRWQASIKTGKPFDMTFPLKGADGNFRPFITRVMPVKDEAGKVIHWTGTNTDISDRLQIEAEREAAAKRVITTIESMGDAFFQVDKNWRIVLVNKGFEKLAKKTRKQVLGKDFRQLFPETQDPKSEYFKNYHYVMSKQTPANFVDYYQPLELWTEVRVYPTEGGMSVFFSDISSQKQAEGEQKELLRLEKERSELLKLSKAKDEFIGIASHQLRTPATAVKQYIGIVLSGLGGELSENQREYLQTAYDSNERQLKLINDLLKTAQIDAETFTLNRKPHSLCGLLQAVAAELQTTLDMKKQRLVVTGLDQDISVPMDEIEIKLVFLNVIENASKYSHENTDIKVVFSCEAKAVQISITDKGVGIRNEDQAKIFDKFTRIDNELSDTIMGTGLGLYWVKQIIEMHGGGITVSSKLNKGTTFTVRLPL